MLESEKFEPLFPWEKKLRFKIKRHLEGAPFDHDWSHALRTRNYALQISKKEKVDLEIIVAASLLHDTGHTEESHQNHMVLSMRLAERWLEEVDFPSQKIPQVLEAIEFHDEMWWPSPQDFPSNNKELLILEDADKLDALGAIGLARTLIFISRHWSSWPSSDSRPTKASQKEKHFQMIQHIKKLLKIKDRMNTEEGKRLALAKHKFIKDFLKRFYLEWQGKG